jgi:hypothetical protein
MMSDELKQLLNNISGLIDRKMVFLGWLNRQLEAQNIKELPILVGGSAVSFYTAGNFASLDIDLCYDSIFFAPILLKNGFRKDGRYWSNDELQIVLECPGSRSPEKINCIKLPNGDKVLIISLEDIIIDRLCAFKFWGTAQDGEWAKIMFCSASSQISIDFQYLERRARDEDVLDVLKQIETDIKKKDD